MKQLAWVNDGYQVAVNLAGRRHLFRPMVRRERMELLSLDPDFGLLSQAMAARIVTRRVDVGYLKAADWMTLWRANFPAAIRQEKEDLANLREGVRLYRKFPHLGSSPCQHCRAYWFDPETGITSKMDGKPLERPPEAELLCRVGECPVGTPERPRTLSLKNQLAYRHYLECEAIGLFPDDPIVRRNAEVIREALK